MRACPKTTWWVHNLVTVVKKDETLSSPMPRSTKFEINESISTALFMTLYLGRMFNTALGMASTSPPLMPNVDSGHNN